MKHKFIFFATLFVLLIIGTNTFSQSFGCNAWFNSSEDYIDLGNNAGYYGTTLTVEARIKADSWKTEIYQGNVLSCASWNTAETGWDLRAANDGNLSFNYSDGSGWDETMTSNNPMSIDQWYHVAATFDNGVVKIYIDGVEVATNTYTTNISAALANLYIGTCPGATDRNFNGYIDEVRIWNVALDGTTISNWYNQELNATHPNYANIVAYIPFTDQSLTDASENGNNGSAAGTVEIANCSETCPDITDIISENITTSTADISWTAGDSETAWNFIISETEITDFTTVTPSSLTDPSYSATGLSSETTYYVYVQADCGSGDEASWIGSSFITQISCPAPTDISIENITTSTADISWTAGASETEWNIIISETEITDFSSETPVSVSETSYQATGLNAATEYFVYVQANCGVDDESSWTEVAFYTDCETITNFPWTEEFENWDAVTNCWDLSGGSQQVSQYNSNSVKANYWNWPANSTAYLTSLNFDLSSLGTPAIEFYWSHKYNSTYPNDSLALQITEDAGATWTTVWSKSGADLDSGDGAGDTSPGSYTSSGAINLDAFSDNIAFRFYFHSGWGPDCFVDNVSIFDNACPYPSGLTVENITSGSADISWTAGASEAAWNIIISETEITDFSGETPVSVSETSYQGTSLTPDTDYYVYVQADCGGTTSNWTETTFTTQVSCPVPTDLTIIPNAGESADISWIAGASETNWNIIISETEITDFSGETPIALTTNSYEATGLTADIEYYVYVQADCGTIDGTSVWAEASFYNGYCIPAPSSTDGNGITNVTFGQGTVVNNETTGSDGYVDYSGMTGDAAAGLNLDVDITFSTGYAYNTGIFIDWNNDLDFNDEGELVYTGTSSADNPTTLNASFTIPVSTPLGTYRMRIFGADGSTPTPCYTGTYGAIEDYTLNVTPAPDCLPVTDIVIENITAHSADISWTAGDSETTWNVIISETEITDFSGETPEVLTTDSYQATDLTAETDYYVYVQADCGGTDGTSFWTSATFTTEIACPVISGLTINNITSNSADISWTAGGSEASWNIIISETEVTDFESETPVIATAIPFQASGLSQDTYYYVYVQADCGVTDGTSQWVSSNFTTEISCPVITDLALTDVTLNSATITWTAGSDETEWNVIVSETEVTDFTSETPVTVTTNSYEATELEYSTSYYVYVQANCGGTDGSSNWAGPIVISDQSGRTCFYSAGNEYSNSYAGSYFEIPTNSTFDLVKEVSIEAWVKTNNADQNQKIIGKTDSGGGSFTSGYMLGIDDGRVYPEIWDQDGGHYTMTDSPELYDTENGTIYSNKWTHIAFTFSAGDKFNGYVNGHLVYSVDVPDVLIGINSFDLILGAAPWDIGYFGLNGYVDDIRIWKGALDSTEINQWMHKQVTSDHPSFNYLVANYTFESHSDTYCIDVSPNSNNGVGTRINWEDAFYPYASYSDTYLNNVEGVWDAYTSNYSTVLTVNDADISAENGIAFGDDNQPFSLVAESTLDVEYRAERQWRFENIQNNTFDINVNMENINVSQFDSLCIITASNSEFTQNVEYFTLEVLGNTASFSDFNMTTNETFLTIGAYSDEPVDIIPPVIAEVADDNVCVENASEWVAPETTATDDTDGDISAQIVITYSTNGGTSFDATLNDCRTYLETENNQVIVAYNVSDAAGNNATEETATFTAEVCGTPDVTPPVIAEVADDNVCVENASVWVAPTTTASDDTDGDISAQIVITYSINGGTSFDASLDDCRNHLATNNNQVIVAYNVSDAAGNNAIEETATFTAEICDGIFESTDDIDLSIYPNPNNGRFRLKLEMEDTNDFELEIRNTIGQTIVKQRIENESSFVKDFDLGDLSKGSYVISISFDNTVITKRFMVK